MGAKCSFSTLSKKMVACYGESKMLGACECKQTDLSLSLSSPFDMSFDVSSFSSFLINLHLLMQMHKWLL